MAYDKKDVAAFAEYKEASTSAPKQQQQPTQETTTQAPPKKESVSTANIPEHQKVTMPALSPTMAKVIK